MSIDLTPLLEKAFFVEDVQNASELVARALEKYEQKTHNGGRPYEVVAPADPDEAWVRERLARSLVYFCDSDGAAVPMCAGIVVALFVGARMYAIAGDDVIRWTSDVLHANPDELRAAYGTHEVETALR